MTYISRRTHKEASKKGTSHRVQSDSVKRRAVRSWHAKEKSNFSQGSQTSKRI